MILILSLLTISLCEIRSVLDQIRQPYIFQWESTQQGSGIISQYCPLGINQYLYEKSNEDYYYYFLQSGHRGEEQELFYLIYMEIQLEQKLIIFHVIIKLESGWMECTFPFESTEVEGIQISTIVYFSEQGEIFVEQYWGEDFIKTFIFPNTNLPNFKLTQISGGIYSDINPITKTNIKLKQFSGKLLAALLISKEELNFLWFGFPYYQGDNQILLLKERIDLQERVTNQFYTISTSTQRDYCVTFWVKAQPLYDKNFDQILHIIRIVANRFTQDFKATGSNSFILDYVYNKQSQQWIIRFNFYSYVIPVLISQIPDDSVLSIDKEIIIDNYSYINTWHFIIIQYQQNTITFSFQNPSFNFRLDQQYENVYQYQLIYYRLFFGGTLIETNTLDRSFTLISFQDFTGSYIKCHLSCSTCFGPYYNNCSSCLSDSNRIYDPIEQTCQCQLWYLEQNEQNCQLLSNSLIDLFVEENIQNDDQKVNCNFGEFEYNGNCYQCPSASQNNQIVCSACLMRPQDWVQNQPECYDIYYQYENNPNYQFVQMMIDQEIANQYYVFENDQLQPCNGCKLCKDKFDNACNKSSYLHLNKETYIQCLQGYQFNNGKCIKSKQELNALNISCQNNCLKCRDGQCLICSNKNNVFLNYMGQCQLCTINNCQYCFQYNSLYLIENSISKYGEQKNIISEDFEIGCAKCLQGYIYSFKLKQCLLQNNDNNFSSYITVSNELQTYSTKFEQLITKYQQIQNCQEQLPNCVQCIYTKFSLLVCVQCSQGFYINKVNGLCNKCVDPQALDCQLVDLSNSFTKLNLQGFVQHLTQHLNELLIIYNDFDRVNVIECKQNYLVDIIQNKCIDQCQNCDQCAIIHGQKQCIKCKELSNQSNFYSQKQGNCYRCPQLCRFCLQIDLDLIQQYNPYFYITESSKTQAMKCLINYDQNLTYIDYLSGQVQPLNNITKQRQIFSFDIQIDLDYVGDFDDIVLKSVSKVVQQFPTAQRVVQSFLNYYYSVNNLILNQNIRNDYSSKQFQFMNASEIRINKLTIQNDKSFFNISSQFGVKFYAEDCTLTKQISKQLFQITFPLIVNFTLFNIYEVTIQDSQVIIINSNYQNSKILFCHFLQTNSIFINSIFLLHSSDYQDNVFLNNLTFINCTFKSSIYFSQKAFVKINNIQMSIIKLINCTFKDSILFQVSESIRSFTIIDFQVINCTFLNSSLIYRLENLRLEQILLNNLTVIDSNLFLSSYSVSNQTIIMANLICQGLLFNKSTILFIENLHQFININVIIKDWNLGMINLNVNNEIIIDNSILIFYNVNCQIKNVIMQQSILFTLLTFQNCLEIILNNIKISQLKNEVEQLDKISKYTKQRYVIYISEFNFLEITQLQILNWIQTSDSFLIIRCDTQITNLISLSELYIEYYSSFNFFNQINSAILIQLDTQVKITLTNSIFKRCNFWSSSPNNVVMEAALIRIKSPQSQVILDSLIFEIANVYNSSNSIIVIDATTILMLNTNVDDINNENTINQLYSICGFALFMAEQIKIINIQMNNINSAQYGFFYIQTKQQGYLYVQDCNFNSTKLANTKLYLTQLGGIFTIDGQLSKLQIRFINITAINIYAEQKAAFLYLIPSSFSNQVFMQNLKFINLISASNLFCKLQFPSNSKNNTIVLHQIHINNDENSTLLQSLIQNIKKVQSAINYEGIISSSFSYVLINDFIYEGYLTQPIFELNIINGLNINSLKFVSLVILNQIQYLIYIEIQNAKSVQINNVYFEKIHLQHQLEYFLKLNCSSFKNSIITNSIFFINNLCPKCQNGLITIFNNQKQTNIMMNDYIFYNNYCGLNSCLIFHNLQLTIHNSMFIYNIGQNNGILQGTKSKLLLQNNIIIKNNQIENQAGAIYLIESLIDADNLIIVNNSAQIAGAIYFENSKLNNQTKKQILFYENFGQTGLNNIREEADFIKLNMYGYTIHNTRQIQDDQIFDSPSYIINYNQMRINDTFISVASGQKLNEFQVFDKSLMKYSNYTIQLQIEQYTQLGEKIINDQGDKCYVTQYEINSELNKTNNQILLEAPKEDMTLLKFDNISESYKLDNFSFYLDPYSNQSIFLFILIKCEQMSQNYNFIFTIKTLPCGIGEYYNNKQCLKCDYDKGYYSVKQNSLECQRLDPTKMKSVTSYQIELLTGFWRYSYYSHYVEQCENSFSCLGGWNVDYESCYLGYIGAICNECDVYNIRGQSSYIKSLSGVCQKKENQQEIFFITLILLIFTFVITYLISFLKSETHLMYKRMKQLTIHYKILYQCEMDQLNTSLKLLINFMQILYPILASLKFSFNFTDIAWPIGKSSKTLLYLVNFVAEEFQLEIIYLKMVYAILIPIIQISILLCFYTSIKRILNSSHIQLMFIWASCIFLLFYSMPNIIEELTIVIQRRTIVNIDWIGANLAYQYQTEEHKNWIWQFIMPFSILILLVIPIVFFTYIFKKNKQTNFDISYGIYGYLCSDYKQHLYFWEIVNLEMKLILIFIIFFLDNDKIILKNLIVIIILLGYYVSISTLKPFSKQNLNHLEKFGIIFCCVFISLNILSLTAQKFSYIEVQYLSQILMLLIILLILLYTLLKILLTFINKYQDIFDKLRIRINLRYPNLRKNYSFFRTHLKLRFESRRNINNKIKRIKLQLKHLKLNNIKIIRNTINVQDELVSNIQRSDHRQLIPKSQQNSFLF